MGIFDFFKSNSWVFICAFAFSACDEAPYAEHQIQVVVPYSKLEPVAEIPEPSPDNIDTQLSQNPEQPEPVAKIEPTPSLEVATTVGTPDAESSAALSRGELKQYWNDIKKLAQEKGWSPEDMMSLVPRARGIENYIKYGEPVETQQKLNGIETEVKNAQVTEGYFRKKVNRTLELLSEKELSTEDFSEFQNRINQLESFIKIGELEKANKNLNTILIDIQQIEKLEKVLQ